MTPVFIIGGSRTGSELLKNILRKYTDIDMVGEACLLCPRWLHRDFVAAAKRHAGGLGDTCDVNKLIELMYSKRLFGHFWSTIDQIDREELKSCIQKTDKSLSSIFSCLLDIHAAMNHKKRPGAKFPVHYSSAPLLLEWFRDCKIIHTTRDPRAVYISQSRKYMSEEYSAVKNAWIGFQHLVHINIQSVWTSQIHEKLKGRDNYFLSRYEDLVSDPGRHLRELCRFLEADFDTEMARPTVFSNSSFSEKRGRGRQLQTSSIFSWKSRINCVEEKILLLIGGRAMARLGYARNMSDSP